MVNLCSNTIFNIVIQLFIRCEELNDPDVFVIHFLHITFVTVAKPEHIKVHV